jgi:hypothetical protein
MICKVRVDPGGANLAAAPITTSRLSACRGERGLGEYH